MMNRLRFLRLPILFLFAICQCWGCSREKIEIAAASPPSPPPADAPDNGAPSPASGNVLFLINGVPVVEEELRVFAELIGEEAVLKGKRFPPDMVDTFINNRLLAELAVKEQVDRIPDVVGQLEVRRNKIWIDPYWSRVVKPTVRIRDEEILAKAPEMEEMVSVQVIVVDTREEAEDVRRRVLDGEKFGPIIREHSTGLSAEKEGKLGYIKRDSPLFDRETLEEIFRMKPGEYSPVLESRIGHIFLKILDRKDPAQLKKEWFAVNHGRIRSELEREAWVKHRIELAKKHKVEIDRKVVEEYFSARKDKAGVEAVLRKVAVTVDGVPFLVLDLVDPSGMGVIHGEQTLEMIANDRVEEFAIAREIEKRGLKKEFPRMEMKERALTEAFLARKYVDIQAKSVTASEEEIRALFDERKDRYKSPRMLDVSLIETRSEKRLETIYSQLASGVPFAKVASEWSDNRKVPEGRVGFVPVEKINPEFSAVKSLKPGEYLKDPIRLSPKGSDLTLFIVARLNAVREERPLAFGEVKRDLLAKTVVARKREAIVKKIVENLRKNNRVEFTDRFKSFAGNAANPTKPHGRN